MLSTENLTTLVAVGAPAACFVMALYAVHKHKPVPALTWGGASMLFVHLGVVLFGESAVVDYYQSTNAYLGLNEPDWPALAGFPTWAYDLPALVGLALLGAAAVLVTIDWWQRRR